MASSNRNMGIEVERGTQRDSRIQIVKDAIEEEERYKSASRDARKMYGDVTPGDTTHQDVTLEYTNHFKHEHRNLPRALGAEGQQKYEVWQLSADIVKTSFEVNRDRILNKMRTDLENALSLENDKPGPIKEDKKDLQRAFKMMVDRMMEEDQKDGRQNSQLKEIKQQVMQDSGVDERTFDFVMDMIVKLDPADYKSFIEKDKQRDRMADLKHLYDTKITA